MKTTIALTSAITLACSLASVPSFAAKDAHWGYEGNTGPSHWAELSDANFACAKGKNQSPINIERAISAKINDLKTHYKSGVEQVINNGHTIQANYRAGSSIEVDGHSYALKQFHFHTPSENMVDGKQYPLEMHAVHLDNDGNIAVVGVLFEEGSTNPQLAEVLANVDKGQALNDLDVRSLLPKKADHYRFNGSLTTPPCTEGVKWLVMKQHATLDKQQIAAFNSAMQHNNRPIQQLNARVVVK